MSSSVRLLSRLSRISSAGERCSRVVAGGSPSCIRLLYSKMRSMTSCFPNNIRKNRDQELAPDRQANPLNEPLCTHSPSCSRHCLKRVARSWGQGWPGACEGPPGGLGLDAGEDGATLERPGAAAAIGISALRQAQGTLLALRQAQGTLLALRQAQGTVARPSTSSGHRALLALRQAQGTGLCCPSTSSGHRVCSPFDKLRASCSPFDKLRAQGFARPSTSSGHIAIDCPSTGSGHIAIDCPSTSSGHMIDCPSTGSGHSCVGSPFDRLRAQCVAGPSTGSGRSRAIGCALRQAQGTFRQAQGAHSNQDHPITLTQAARRQDPG